MATGDIKELASLILKNATIYETYFMSHGLPAPSFEADAFPEAPLPAEVVAARETILEASTELQELVRGPVGIVRNTATYHAHLAGIQAIYRYGIATSVPATGDISYTDLSKACGLNEADLKRLVRYAMTCHIFLEPRKGFVAHSGASKALAEVSVLREWVGMVCDELWPTAARMVDAMQQWPNSQEPTQAGFNIAHNTADKPFIELSKHPARLQRFGKAMSLFSSAPGMEPYRLFEAYPWASIKAAPAQPLTLVDVGGSLGSVSIALAEQFPNLRCIVQDLKGIVEKAQAQELSSDLKDRVEFMEHDFFTSQPVIADIYFFRWIFHDWSDKYCLQILQSLVPAMRPGSRVLINEFCIPEPGMISAYREKIMRSFDLVMFSMQNSKERDASDWASLFEQANPRFHMRGVTPLPNSPIALIEAVWEDPKEA